MTIRPAALLCAALLALPLAGCGSDDSAEAPSSSSADSAAAEATGEDYRALLAALLEQQASLQQATTPEQMNKLADFPEGVSVAELDPQRQRLCIEDSTQRISLALGSNELVLDAGLCADGEEVATLVPKGRRNLAITGDKALAKPVADYVKQQ